LAASFDPRLQMSEILEVVAAVLTRPDGRFLLASRPPGKVYAGYWEFPGGKVEAGESHAGALARELEEELGVTPTRAARWLTRVYAYPHATVRLNFFRVWDWTGEPQPREGQTLAWFTPAGAPPSPLLPANFPILAALALPPVLGISQAEALGVEPFLARLDSALAAGLGVVQVRDKGLATRADLARATLARTRAVGAKAVFNGDLDSALALGMDGVHLDAAHAAALRERPPASRADGFLLGVSCHDAAELAHAAALDADYALLSPVLPTASHPGAPTLGWARFTELAAASAVPVYALGGLTPADLDTARQHGAHGIALLRGAWS
jgi:8-oxo-dGTP diphosphatase